MSINTATTDARRASSRSSNGAMATKAKRIWPEISGTRKATVYSDPFPCGRPCRKPTALYVKDKTIKMIERSMIGRSFKKLDGKHCC